MCVDIHSRELEQAGESSERIYSVAMWPTRLADHPDPVSDEVWDEAARGAWVAQAVRTIAEAA